MEGGLTVNSITVYKVAYVAAGLQSKSFLLRGKFVFRRFTIGCAKNVQRSMFNVESANKAGEVFPPTIDALTAMGKDTTRIAGAPASPRPVLTAIGPAGKAFPPFPALHL